MPHLELSRCLREHAGLARARGKKLGRPRDSEDVERAIRATHASGKGQIKIAGEVGCGVSMVRRVIGPLKERGRA